MNLKNKYQLLVNDRQLLQTLNGDRTNVELMFPIQDQYISILEYSCSNIILYAIIDLVAKFVGVKQCL